MIPTRSRLARSLSFQVVVDRDEVAAESRKRRPVLWSFTAGVSTRRFRGGTKRPLGNRVKQVVSQTV